MAGLTKLSENEINNILISVFPPAQHEHYLHNKFIPFITNIKQGWDAELLSTDVEQRLQQLFVLQDRLSSLVTPRLLTNDEMNSITNDISLPVTPLLKYSRQLHNDIIKRLLMQLAKIKITPMAIQVLKEKIQAIYLAALIEPGNLVGIHAAQALGQILTQSTLNTFHFTGVAMAVKGGIKAFRELIGASPRRSSENCTIHFANPSLKTPDQFVNLTDLDFLRIRRNLIHVTVEYILKEYTIESPVVFFAGADGIEYPYWYKIYVALYPDKNVFYDQDNNPIISTAWFFRLYLDLDLLYSAQITMEDICTAINNVEGDNLPLYCIPSPLHIGIIDLYPKKGVQTDIPVRIQPRMGERTISEDDKVFAYLSVNIHPQLSKITVRGINKIADVLPIDTPTWSLVDRIEKINKNDERGQWWKCYISQGLLNITNMSVILLYHLLIEVGLIIPEYKSASELPPKHEIKYIHVITPGKKEIVANDYLVRMVNSTIAAARQRDEKSREKDPLAPLSKLNNLSTYYYGITVGSNLEGLYMHPAIDNQYTFSNLVQVNLRYLGIEAARNFLITEFLGAISADGASINYQHINLVVDYMTRFSSLTKITFSGTKGTGYNPLGRAAFERGSEVLHGAGIFGKRATTRGVSESIIIGKLVEAGSAVYERPDYAKAKERLRKRLANSVEGKISATQFTKGIKAMKQADHGTQPIKLDKGLTTRTIVPATVMKESISTKTNTPGIYGSIEEQIQPPPAISGHLASVIDSITNAPCVPPEDTQISVQPVFPEGALTVKSPPITGTRPKIGLKKLPPVPLFSPVRGSIGGQMPPSLQERMELADKINIGKVKVKPLPPTPSGKTVPTPTPTLPSRATIAEVKRTDVAGLGKLLSKQ